MKEELKDILLMGLGAISLTNDKAKELKEELRQEGMKVYEAGKVKNEELKHHIEENISSIVNIVPPTKEEMAKTIKTMSKEEKAELLSLLKDNEEEKNAENDGTQENN